MSNKVNPIDPPALKEFLGEMPFSKFETLVTAEYDRFRIMDSRTRRLNGYSVSDEIAISIALSWLESEIMGVAKWRHHIWRVWEKTVRLVVYVDGGCHKIDEQHEYNAKTKLTALIAAYKEIVK